MRVLIVEDEAKMAKLLARGLREEGHVVDVAATGAEGLWLAGSAPFDVIVLDRMLPDGDATAVCEQLRRQNITAPVLMLTARDSLADRITGLDAGADDYLTKPFEFDELLARLRALSRREFRTRPVVIRVGDLAVDPAARRVHRGAVEIALTPKEFALLEVLVRHPGQLFTRADLVESAWDFAYESRSNVVDVHVRSLRAKLDKPFGTDTLETVRGAGYRLRAQS